MQVDTAALKGRASEIYNDFTTGQRAMLGLGVVGLIIGSFVFLQWSGTQTYRPLLSGLEASDAAEVTAELDSMGVGYQLQDGGRTIAVPAGDLHETRIALSAQGLPRNGSDGYELLDNQSITTSEFRQRIDLQRAMEGELAATIATIDAVDRATVHLVMPEDDLFSGDDVHASASVLVEPRNSQSLSATQVQAIVHLVASSVEGLVPANVTVADNAGRVLSAEGSGFGGAGVEARLAQKVAFEQALARTIEQDLLEPITGPGKARVVVSAELDNDDRVSYSESFAEPDTSPVISQETSNENYVNADGQIVGGVLGPEVEPVLGDGEDQGTSYTKEDSSVLFGVDKVTEQVTSAPGGVARLSIAVVVDEATGADTAALTQLVGAAAGIQEARGDQLQVSAVAFGEIEATDGAGTSSDGVAGDDLVPQAIRTVAVLGLVALVLFLAYRSAKKSSLARYPIAIPLPTDAQDLLALELDLRGDEDDDDRELEPADAIGIGPSEPSPQLVLQNQIGELIDRQPEDVAAVLRTWLADRRA